MIELWCYSANGTYVETVLVRALLNVLVGVNNTMCCDRCPKAFATKDKLARHAFSHAKKHARKTTTPVGTLGGPARGRDAGHQRLQTNIGAVRGGSTSDDSPTAAGARGASSSFQHENRQNARVGEDIYTPEVMQVNWCERNETVLCRIEIRTTQIELYHRPPTLVWRLPPLVASSLLIILNYTVRVLVVVLFFESLVELKGESVAVSVIK